MVNSPRQSPHASWTRFTLPIKQYDDCGYVLRARGPRLRVVLGSERTVCSDGWRPVLPLSYLEYLELMGAVPELILVSPDLALFLGCVLLCRRSPAPAASIARWSLPSLAISSCDCSPRRQSRVAGRWLGPPGRSPQSLSETVCVFPIYIPLA